MKHKDKRDPKSWKGFKFAVPFDYSMHNYLLRYYVAEFGIDPDQDIQIRSVPPPEMVANLRAGNIDGFLAPDPVNQRAVYDGVGFIHILSKDIWDRHPCCAFAASDEFVKGLPNTYAALLKSIIDATAFATKSENRKQIAAAIAPANYLNQPVTVVEQVLTGTFADGLGKVHKVPDRVDFDPFPWHSFAVWIMTQMKRWGQIKGDINYDKIAKDVYLATDTAKLMAEIGLVPPKATSKSFVVMGKTFDPAKPEEYIKSFKIKKGA
jgi:nitrate/nitrite transport system substrate-binding protein